MKNDFNDYFIKCLSLLRHHNAKSRTIENFEKTLPLFFRFLESLEVNKLADVTKEHVEDYQNHLYHHRMLNGKPYSVWTQITYLSLVSTFFRYLVEAKLLINNPATDIKLPKRGNRLPKGILSLSELRKFISQPDRETVFGFRDYCIISVFMSTGIRTDECCNLQTKDLDFDHGFISIREGKGLKDGNVPCSEPVLSDLKVYLEDVRPHLAKANTGDDLFLSSRGTKISKHSIYHSFRNYSKAAKLKKVILPRYFRYTLSTEMIRRNPSSSLRETQMLLRHGSLNSLDAYIQVLKKDLKREYQKRHPTARGELIN